MSSEQELKWRELILSEIQNGRKEAEEGRKTVGRIYEKLDDVKSELETKIDDIFKKEVVPLRESVAGLQVKAGMWGAFAGMIPVLVVISLMFLKHKFPEASLLQEDTVSAAVSK